MSTHPKPGRVLAGIRAVEPVVATDAAAVPPEKLERMDRRFICESCGMKWHVPAGRTDLPDPLRCGSCDGALVPFIAPAGNPVGQWRSADRDGNP
jgi:hypothetical protein